MPCIKASLIYTGRPEPPLRNAYLSFEGSKITYVGCEKPSNTEVWELEGSVITPALIDPHCHIGMERAGEPSREAEVNERFESVVPLADALYSIYMDDRSFKESIEFGVLYSCVLPGSANIIGGRGVVIRNYGGSVEEAYIKSAGVKAALGFNPRSVEDWKGTRPHTRMGAVAVLRRWLDKAASTMRLVEQGKKDIDEVEPELKALFPILRGEEVMRVHAHRADDAIALLKLREAYGFKATVEHLCDVSSKEVFKRIKEAGVPIVYGPIDSFPYKTELRNESYRNVKLLVEVSPFYGLMSDHPSILQRNFFLQLRFFRRFGLSQAECISIVTLRNAQILGVDSVLGVLEAGKWASFTVWSGDPFSLDAYPVLVVGEGRELHSES
ncbi:MAG: amidohydrolase family protein [Candidatus Nezhaarchaeota archaeon]|nr:amidohydrolase family protein [Candidatus Nezhaarchaeota archaeon]